jgi:hypothetical protein
MSPRTPAEALRWAAWRFLENANDVAKLARRETVSPYHDQLASEFATWREAGLDLIAEAAQLDAAGFAIVEVPRD